MGAASAVLSVEDASGCVKFRIRKKEAWEVEKLMTTKFEMRSAAFGCFWLLVSSLVSLKPTSFALGADGAVDFTKHIQPLLAKKCVSCHGPEKQKAGLRLDRKSAAFKGGDDFGSAIVPGKSRESPLFRVVTGLEAGVEMPAEGEKLTGEEIELLKRWIDSGAKWPDDGSEKDDVIKSHWAYRPLVRLPLNAVPFSSRSQNSVDSFVLARLKESKLQLNPEADRTTLIRRLKFDLLGLPPNLDEIAEFISDPQPDAYERLVDRFLASPHFGERWARHWLDIVRFAESHGFEMNQPRPNAWPYRDYVIRS